MLTEGQVLDGKYRVTRLLARSGMAAVYVGENFKLHRQVAIKVLSEQAGQDDAISRFEREAQAAGRIGSDHICEVLDLGVLPTGEHFMVMEYLEGQTLRQRLRATAGAAPGEASRGVEPEHVVPIFDQVLEGLAAAHKAGIIHRDLKPANVFILQEKAGRPDFVKILDFGISKFASLSADVESITRTGTVMGTPFYMSPEQVKAAHLVDPRTDLYAVGVMLFEAVTGRVPFKAGTIAELLFKIVYEPSPQATELRPDLDPELGAIVHKAIAREPAERYQTAREMQAALTSWHAARTTARRAGAPMAPPPSRAPIVEAPEPPDDAPTLAAAAVVAPAPVERAQETLKNWDSVATGPVTSPRRGRWPWIAALAATAIGAAAWAISAGSGEPAAPAPASQEAPTSVEPSAPRPVPSAPSVEATATAAPSATASAPAPASATASATASAVASPGSRKRAPVARPGTATTGAAASPKAPGTVSDFGY